MGFTKNLEEIDEKSICFVGGKGMSLGKMIRAEMLVPHGFVILATAFEKFLAETDLNVEIESILRSVNYKNIRAVENASEKIEALILDAEMPEDIREEINKSFKNLNSKYVAVRSSATAEDSANAAWAGQLKSYLNTREEILLENIKRCWISLFAPRAIFYCLKKKLHKQRILVAVVIQKMVESEKSGIAFSVHPITQDANQLIIESSFGLGEAIVSGKVTPNSYVVEKHSRRIIDKNIQAQLRMLYCAENGVIKWREISKNKSKKQILFDGEILELSQKVIDIEKLFGFPCDIEWAMVKNKFYFLQARPITTLKSKTLSL